MAQEHNLDFTPHTWGNGIGLMANAQLTAGCANAPYLEFPYDPPQWRIEVATIALAEPVRVDKDGWLVLCDRPGLGIALDETLLEKTQL